MAERCNLCLSDYNRFFNNKYLLGAFALGTILVTLVIMIPGLQGLFKVQTLTITQLLIVYFLAFLNLPVIQLIKLFKDIINPEKIIQK